MKANTDIMNKNAMLQRKSMVSAGDPACDIMSKYAMLQYRQTRFIYCPKCGDLQREKTRCDKCNTELK